MATHSLVNSFVKINHVPDPEQIWVCFHYLGGSASAFFPWKTRVPDTIQLYAMQLPGREGRRNEPFFREFAPLIDIYFDLLLSWGLRRPFVFYGHSMGALIAYELIARLEQLPHICEHQLVVSACKAPHIIKPVKKIDGCRDQELIHQLYSYGGTPKAILDDKLLLNSLLPRLRADTEVLESYYCHNLVKLKCPIYAFGGSEDNAVPVPSLFRWADCTESIFHKKIYPGGHFFINQMLLEIIREIFQATQENFFKKRVIIE